VGNDFFRLTHRISQTTCATLTNYIVLIIFKDFTSNDEAECIYYVRVARDVCLRFAVEGDSLAFRLDLCQTKRGDAYIFFVCAIRFEGLEEIGMFYRELRVLFTIPAVDARYVRIGSLHLPLSN
jgi:hypothetical protein